VPTLAHLSDIHFGPPEVPAHVAAVERRLRERRWDMVAISGDLTQRAFPWQFEKARAFVDLARASAPTVVIPGNHDVAWWWCVGGLGLRSMMYRGYRRRLGADLEPVLHAPDATVSSVNSSHGLQWHTLTTRLRDLSVVGAVRPSQWARATAALASARAGDLKVLMLHHNLLAGRLSRRWGLTSRAAGIDEAAATGCDLVLCGHDHEARVEEVERNGRRFVVSQVNTISDRSRGARPASFHEVSWDAEQLTVRRQEWSAPAGDFVDAQSWCFAR
jgi:3',5'-cyclic AMP phosphodiesterase CpdA